MVGFQGLSKAERLKKYAEEPEKHKFKEAINCLKDDDCNTCDYYRQCHKIATKKKLGILKKRAEKK